MPDEEDHTIVLSGSQVLDAQLVAVAHGLAMEINMQAKFGYPPTACPTRGRALATAKRILTRAGKWDGRGRLTRRRALTMMIEHCKSQGINANPRLD